MPMNSCQIRAFGTPLEPAKRNAPRPQGGEVLLRVSHCGICHTDLHLQDGYFDLGEGKRLDLTAHYPLPLTPGHEVVGYVEAIGEDVTDLKPGDARVVYPWIGCGDCPICKQDEEHLCDRPRAIGLNTDGGYSTHVLVPDAKYLLDFSGIDPTIAATCMCSGLTAYSALKKVAHGIPGKGSLLLIGLGGVGLMGLQLARAMRTGQVIGADIAPDKLEAAVQLGATLAVDAASPNAAKQILKASNGGVGAIIDFVGSQASTKLAMQSLRKGGAAIVVGLVGGSLSIPVPTLPLRATSIGGSYVGSLAEARELLASVASGVVAPIPIQTRRLSSANQSLDDLRAGTVVGRIILSPDPSEVSD